MMESEESPYPKTIFGKLLRSFFLWTGSLSGDGSRKIRPIHQDLLNKFLPTLEDEIQLVVVNQLEQPFYMQFNDGMVSIFYFDDFNLSPSLRISHPEFRDRLYKIEMFVDGRKEWAHITFYKGRIFSIEFKNNFKFYKNKDVIFGAVVLGKSKQSYAGAIDRLEHGKNSQYATGEE
ncbi:MAG: hypothetical protein IPN84_16315 [Sphingomonadales bacterium]|nr:hypothetical protein [Sphingomonadales bacterium]